MGLLLTLSSQASSLEGLLNCRKVTSDTERLECFDRIAGEFCKNETCEPELNSDELGTLQSEESQDEASFGLSAKAIKNEPEKIESSIKDVRFASYGKHVFTLENGQVWMENEPGRKKVKNQNQKVVIKKKGLRYLISFESGVVLAVHRIE